MNVTRETKAPSEKVDKCSFSSCSPHSTEKRNEERSVVVPESSLLLVVHSLLSFVQCPFSCLFTRRHFLSPRFVRECGPDCANNKATERPIHVFTPNVHSFPSFSKHTTTSHASNLYSRCRNRDTQSVLEWAQSRESVNRLGPRILFFSISLSMAFCREPSARRQCLLFAR